MDNAFNTLFEQVQKLSPIERLRMLALLASSLENELVEKTVWHAALRAAYDILADDPIERHFDLTQSTISHYIKVLCDAGLITSEARAASLYHRVNRPMLEQFHSLLTAL